MSARYRLFSGQTCVIRFARRGNDDSYFSVSADPALTTIRQPMVDMGAEMARVLVRLIEGQEAERVTMLETRLVVRDSA